MDEQRPIDPADLDQLHELIPRRAYLEDLNDNGKASDAEKQELAALRRDLAERLDIPRYEE